MIVLRNALAEVRRNPRRVIAVVVAIMISVGYLTASVTVLASESTTMERNVIARTANVDVVVTLADDNQSLVQRIRQVDGVKSADLSFLSHGRVTGSSEWVQQQSVPDNPALRWTDLAEGQWPAGPDEIVLGTVTAQQLNMRIGGQITINDANSSATLRVTGLTHEGNSLLSGLAQSSFVAGAFYDGSSSIRQSLQTEILVVGTIDPGELAERIRAVAGPDPVETSSAFAQRKISEQTNGVYVFELLLLVFGAIALLVGGIMIVNTFLILVAQRRRQIGLLRAIGASRAQIRRSLVAEALTVGLAGSVLGVSLGIGVAAVVAGSLDEVLIVPIGQVTTVALVGVVIAVLAVLVPARRATRLSPLEALKPVADPSTERRSSRTRTVMAVALLLAGSGSIWAGFGDSPYALLLTVGGEFLFGLGFLLATGMYLPTVLRTFGALLSRARPTARLAAANTIRNPGRAAATAAALVLAVGVVVTLQVGTASIKASADRSLDTKFPIDVTVSMFDGALPANAPADIAAVAGIAKVQEVKATRASVRLGSSTKDLRVLGPDGGVADGQALADPYLLDPSITEVTVTSKNGSVVLPVKPDYRAPTDALVVSPAVLAKLDPSAPVGTVWATAEANADITALRSQLRQVVAPITGAEVGGGLSAKASYNEFLDRLLLVTTMLLAVAVVIALIGVGNTLGLSVLERTRESALLRALGLPAGSLRAMLAIEAVLLSFAATVAGIAIGVVLGWIGTLSITDELDLQSVAFAMSPTQTIVVALVAVLAGIVASVLPGRRAARAVPVAALAED